MSNIHGSKSLVLCIPAIYLLLFAKFYNVDAQCPTLPSGFCFIDCTRSVYRIACENISGRLLFSDIQVYINTTQNFELSLWNSPLLSRLGTAIFYPVTDQVTRMYLDNLVNLEYFPELRKMTQLLRLHIMNSPKLKSMPAELLPSNLQTLYLHQTGITDFYNHFDEVPKLDGLRDFAFSYGTVTSIQPNFFKLFPGLTTMQFVNTTFVTNHLILEAFETETYLKNLEIRQNKWEMPLKIKQQILLTIITSVKMAERSRFDFSDNNLPITEGIKPALNNLRNVSYLSLRNNVFHNYIYLPGVFKKFRNLVSLDLGGTRILPSKGFLAGLPKLSELRLGNNNFGDSTFNNMFENCLAKRLAYLDLSRNAYHVLPKGLRAVSSQLKELSLAGNRLNMVAIQNLEEESNTTFAAFPNLRRLDLSSNKFRVFNGSHLSSLTKLEFLDLSCNNFEIISQDYFVHLSRTLTTVNLTFCARQEVDTVYINNDAFSGLSRVRTLILQQGYLKSSIFRMFQFQVDAHVTMMLDHLDLSHNIISYIPQNESAFANLKQLKTLKLGHNLLQSVRKNAFAALSQLQVLDISYNEISSIGSDAFSGLEKLQILNLAGNNLFDVDQAILMPLPNLAEAYLGNNNITDLGSLFGDGGSEMRHLSIEDLPTDCIDSWLLSGLKNIRWLYLNRSQQIYVATGSFRITNEKILKDPAKPIAFRVATAADQGCYGDIRYEANEDNSVRVIAQDRQSLVYQQLVLNFPVCHIPGFRNLVKLVTMLLCPDS